ncbi:MAG: efflux RND transporter periplasmic adaptor subunit [bacterium]
MKKWIIIIIALVVLLVSVGAVLAAIGKLPFIKKDNKKSASTLRTTFVERGDITVTVSATGTIEPLVTVEVRSKASGAITKMAVETGDKLNAGDLIAEIEKTYTQADVEQAEADLKSARARREQAVMNIELQKQQVEAQIKQAQTNVADAETRLAQLQEQIRLEKEANARQIKEAENDLLMANLRLEQAKNPRPENIKRARAAVDQAKSSMELAESEYNRLKSLHEKSFVSKAEVDSAKAKYESAKSQYESALEQLKLTEQPSSEEEIKLAELNVKKSELALAAAKQKIEQEKYREKDLELYKSQLEEAKLALQQALDNRKQIDVKQKDLESAEASVKRAEVTLKNARDKLEDTVVRAPISGVILTKNVEEGQVISSSMGAMASAGTLLVTMANLDRVYVKTDVDETDIGKVKPGQPVTIVVEAFPDRKFKGEVLKIEPQGKTVQNVTTFNVTTELENPNGILKPGMNASVEILVVDLKDVLVVDNSAIMDTSQGKMVTPVIDGKPGQPIFVDAGVRGWDKTEIIFGLNEGDEVLIVSSGGASAGMPEFMKNMMKNPMSTFQRMQGVGPGGSRGSGGPPPR